MAIDTRNKRGSVLGIDLSFLHIWPNPDGALNQADRQQIAFKYSGILAGGSVVIAWFNGLTTSIRLTGVGSA